MKILRSAFLLLLTAALAFGAGGAAWGATLSIDVVANDPTQQDGNVGIISAGGAASVYYFGNTPPQVTIPLVITGGLGGSTPGNLTLSADQAVSTRIIAFGNLGVSDYVISGDLVIAAQPGGTTFLPVTLIVSDDTLGLPESGTATLDLNYVKVVPALTPMNLTFYAGAGGSGKIAASAPAVNTPSFDLTGTASTWSGGTINSFTSKDFTVNNTAPSPVSPVSIDVRTGTKGIVVTGDNNALVASSDNQPVGSFTAEVRSRGIVTSADAGVNLIIGGAVNAGYDVAVLPDWTGVNALTISDNASAPDSTATSIAWNGLTVSSDYAARKIVISGTPSSVMSNRFVIFAKNSGAVVTSKDFTITVTDSPYQLLLNGETSFTVSGDVTEIFDRTINVEVSGDNMTPISLTLDSGTDPVTRYGLTVSADALARRLFVSGVPSEPTFWSVVVNAAFAVGTIEEARLWIWVNSADCTLTLTPGTIRTAKGVAFGPTDVEAKISPDVALGRLAFNDDPSLFQNGITATVSSDLKTVTFSGTPVLTGTTIFPVNAYSVGDHLLATGQVSVITMAAVGGELFDDDPNEALLYNVIRGTQARYNGNNFYIGVPFHLSFFSQVHLSGLTVSCINPYGVRTTLVEGKHYRLDTDPGTGRMEVVVYLTPELEGTYTFYFAYTYSDGTAYTESVELTAVKEPSRDNDDSSSGCSAFGSGAAAFALCLAFLGKRRPVR